MCEAWKKAGIWLFEYYTLPDDIPKTLIVYERGTVISVNKHNRERIKTWIKEMEERYGEDNRI